MIRDYISQLQNESRRRKVRIFLEQLKPSPDDFVIDIGAEARATHPYSNPFERLYPYPAKLVAVSYQDPFAVKDAYPGVQFVRADGKALPFPDKSFDIAISNATLEHVGFENEQRRFVHEACRVARRCFITTPNKRFPIELHSRLPFVQYMPTRLRNWALAKAGKHVLIQQWGHELNLISARQFRRLFPGDVKVRIFGLRTTFMAETLIAIAYHTTDSHR